MILEAGRDRTAPGPKRFNPAAAGLIGGTRLSGSVELAYQPMSLNSMKVKSSGGWTDWVRPPLIAGSISW